MKALCVTLLAAALLSAAAPAWPAADSLEQRGEYLAYAADCLSCHTAPGVKAFSGGAPLKTPFGNLYAPNITPDETTGIGKWTQAEFARALRQGVRNDGAPLYPAMPYDSYTKISDADISALWAYLRSVPAVKRPSKSNELRFPMNLRSGVAVWQAAYFAPGRFEPAAGKSSEWNRGNYLVQALGHCDGCHTPRNVAMAVDDKHRLQGARIENWFAPDISGDALSRVGRLGVVELASYLKTGRGPGNVKLAGPMAEVVHNSLSHLTDPDLRAMAVYLKDQPAAALSAAPAAPQRLSAEAMTSGKALYEQHCASCHQADGRGSDSAIPALAGAGDVLARQPTNVVTAVLQGFDAQGNWGPMPAFANLLDNEEVALVANYVRSAWGNRVDRLATGSMVSALRGVAQPPTAGRQAELICPQLSAALMGPTRDVDAQQIRASARDHGLLAKLVHDYVAARPQARGDQVIEAMSAAYCRVMNDGGASVAATSAGLADYSQQVAQELLSTKGSVRVRR